MAESLLHPLNYIAASCLHGFPANVGLSFLYRETRVVQGIALLTAAKIRDSADDFFRIVAAG
jgi:hypothetical protein